MKNPVTTLRARILLLVLVAFVPAWVMILHTVSAQRQSICNEYLGRALNLAQLNAYKEEQLIDNTRLLLSAMAQPLGFDEKKVDDCKGLLPHFVPDLEPYANYGVVSIAKEITCSATQVTVPRDASGWIWLDRVLETRDLVLGHYEFGSIWGKPCLLAAAPVLDRKKAVKAAVFAIIDLTWLNRFHPDAAGLHLPPESSLELTDGQGAVLAHYPDAQALTEPHLPPAIFQRIAQTRQAEVIAVSAPDGEPYRCAIAPVASRARENAVFVVLTIPEKIAFAYANQVMRSNLMWLGVVTILVLSAAWFGADIALLRQMNSLVRVSRRLAVGDLKARTGLRHGSSELGQLAKAFDDMALALERRENEHEQAEAHIRDSREQLRRLSVHIQTVREEERTRIAREIHDDLGQALTALRIDLSWMGRRLLADQAPLQQKIQSIAKVIDSTMETVHRLSSELRPGILDDLGLAEAIEWQAEEFQNRTGIACEVQVGCEQIHLTREQSTAIFRIYQETLTNIARHAEAKTVLVALEVHDRNLTLMVGDDGRGITEEQISRPDSYGIMGIRERVLALGGEVNFEGVPGSGTKVVVSIPLADEVLEV
jgi:signal transduction histidine kinase